MPRQCHAGATRFNEPAPRSPVPMCTRLPCTPENDQVNATTNYRPLAALAALLCLGILAACGGSYGSGMNGSTGGCGGMYGGTCPPTGTTESVAVTLSAAQLFPQPSTA